MWLDPSLPPTSVSPGSDLVAVKGRGGHDSVAKPTPGQALIKADLAEEYS